MHDAIQHAAEKGDISENIAEKYDALFSKCSDWFAPSNKSGDEFSLAMNLHFVGLLDINKACRIQSGSFTGYHITFKQAQGVTK